MITHTERGEYADIWVVAESFDNEIKQVTNELLGAARSLADARSSQVWCIVLGGSEETALESLFHSGADRVVVVDGIDTTRFIDEQSSDALSALIQEHKPETVLAGATTRGRTLMPRVANALECGIVGGGIELETDDEGNLIVKRPGFGGNYVSTVTITESRPNMATVRPKVLTAPEPETGRTGEIVHVDAPPADGKKSITSVTPSDSDTIQIADADFIVTGGRGTKGPEGFDLLKKLAKVLDGAVGASRAAVDAGWIPYDHQVGQTGQTVRPRVYIACGVSGQIQHLVGMRSSDCIIAINKDKDAPIMELADIAIVGDMFEVVPALIAELKGD